MSRFKVFYALAVMIFMSLSAHAVSDSYSDGGGGTYWCNVYVSSVSDGKSYGWCTGKDETAYLKDVTMDFAECKAERVECLTLQKLEHIITLWGHFSVTLFVY